MHTNAIEVLDGRLAEYNPAFAAGRVSFSPDARMLMADSANNVIRVELSAGTIDPGLSFPTDVIMGGDGQMFIADSINAAVRWIANPMF
jgi:hypothetical protein